MALYRNISTTFWSDTKVYEDLNISERYLFLYLLTNTQTNLCGCYEIGMRRAVGDTGLDTKEIETIMGSLQNQHHMIRYDADNREVLILNWHKYNWTVSEKFLKAVAGELAHIKTPEFREYLVNLLSERYGIDTVSIPYAYPMDTLSFEEPYPMDTSVATVTVTDTVTDTEIYIPEKPETHSEETKEIIGYLNQKAGTNFRASGTNTKKHINARLNEGYSVEDFKTVIDKKCDTWLKTDMAKYLRPETLFGSKFESYLNEPRGDPARGRKDAYTAFPQREYSGASMEEIERQMLWKGDRA